MVFYTASQNRVPAKMRGRQPKCSDNNAFLGGRPKLFELLILGTFWPRERLAAYPAYPANPAYPAFSTKPGALPGLPGLLGLVVF